jgi:hypothetical protein
VPGFLSVSWQPARWPAVTGGWRRSVTLGSSRREIALVSGQHGVCPRSEPVVSCGEPSMPRSRRRPDGGERFIEGGDWNAREGVPPCDW